MGKKPAFDPKSLPSWFHVIEHELDSGRIYKTYRDTLNDKTYRSLDEVARDYVLGDNSIPSPKRLNIGKGECSSVSIPMVSYTSIPAIPEYVAKDIGSDSGNFDEEEEQYNKTRDVLGIMKAAMSEDGANGMFHNDVHVPKKQRMLSEKENEETGHAASHFEKEEEIAKGIDAPSADAAVMKEN